MTWIFSTLPNHAMPKLDLALFVVFGLISVLGLTSSILCFRQALRVAHHRDGDLKMFFWALGSMIGLIVGGMSAAYIVLPIIYTHLK